MGAALRPSGRSAGGVSEWRGSGSSALWLRPSPQTCPRHAEALVPAPVDETPWEVVFADVTEISRGHTGLGWPRSSGFVLVRGHLGTETDPGKDYQGGGRGREPPELGRREQGSSPRLQGGKLGRPRCHLRRGVRDNAGFAGAHGSAERQCGSALTPLQQRS